MGIQGLLPLLKSIQNPKHISDYNGQTLAIDGYCWLHKGVFGCAVDLALGKPTQKYPIRISFLKCYYTSANFQNHRFVKICGFLYGTSEVHVKPRGYTIPGF